MIYFQGRTDFYMANPTAVTLGKFDGVHRGHQKLMETVRREAKGGTSSVVFAFSAATQNLLMTEQEQRQVIEDLGIDVFVRCPFVPEISGMDPETFVREILLRRLHAVNIVVGRDFRFGHNRAGDAAWLQEHADAFGIKVTVIEKEMYQNREISSSYLKELLQAGEMELVQKLMGRPFMLHGNIIHGRHLGSKLGLPTANIIPPSEKALPPDGVYVTKAHVNGSTYYGMTNIGYKPTVDGSFRGVETFLYDCEENLYGQPLCLEFLHFTRPEKKFGSIDELKAQIESDVAQGRAYFS